MRATTSLETMSRRRPRKGKRGACARLKRTIFPPSLLGNLANLSRQIGNPSLTILQAGNLKRKQRTILLSIKEMIMADPKQLTIIYQHQDRLMCGQWVIGRKGQI